MYTTDPFEFKAAQLYPLKNVDIWVGDEKVIGSVAAEPVIVVWWKYERPS